MTEKRVSQRTGNAKTCQREQEGKMEGQIERRWLREISKEKW